MQLSTVNTSTHNITTQYSFSPEGDGTPIDLMDDHLMEIIDELIDYLNGWEEKASDFELDMNSLPKEPADQFTLKIVGEVFVENDVTPMYVTINIQKR